MASNDGGNGRLDWMLPCIPPAIVLVLVVHLVWLTLSAAWLLVERREEAMRLGGSGLELPERGLDE